MAPLDDDAPPYVFIYGLVDPEQDHHIRYVGASHNPQKRLLTHLQTSVYKARKGLPVALWFLELRKRGLKPGVEVLAKIRYLNHYEWKQQEKLWIRQLRWRGHELLNTDKGGTGTVWPSRALRERWCQARRNRAKKKPEDDPT